jgi:hypothetical protein
VLRNGYNGYLFPSDFNLSFSISYEREYAYSISITISVIIICRFGVYTTVSREHATEKCFKQTVLPREEEG